MRGMKADLSLIRSLTPEDEHPERPVCVNRFQKDGYRLDFVNARHEAGDDNPTFSVVQKLFEISSPKFVILERVNPHQNLTIEDYVQHASDQEKNKFAEVMEPQYAAYLASKSGIPCVIGEPSWKCFFPALMTNENLPYDLEDIDNVLVKIGCSKPYMDGNVFERLNAKISLIRDRGLNSLIAESLEKYKEVLVVYGDGHLVRSRPVLEDMLGPGHILPLVPDPPLSLKKDVSSESFPQPK
jgi:hypothetical protein